MITKQMDTRLNILGAFSFCIIILILTYASSKATNDYDKMHNKAWGKYPGIRYQEKKGFLRGRPVPIYFANGKGLSEY